MSASDGGAAEAHDEAWTTGERLTAALLALLAGLGLLAALLALLAPLAPPPGDLREALRILTAEPGDLGPEPLERFLYTVGVLLLPLCLACSWLAVRSLLRAAGPRRALALAAPWTEWLLTPLALLLLFSAGRAERAQLVPLLPRRLFSLLVAAALALVATAPAAEPFRRRAAALLAVIARTAVAVLLLGMLAFAVFDKEHVRNVPTFLVSFNAFFHSVVQVFLGRELTVDFNNVYGLYPHFLEPLFHLIGLSVLSFTLVMGLLNCLAFGLLHRFLLRETGDRLLALLGLASAVFFGYTSGRALDPDHYFQYHPLRMLFPALALPAAQALADGGSRWLPAGIGALGAAALLWNPDSGLVVLAAGLLLVGYDALLSRRLRALLPRFLLAAAGAALFVSAFSLSVRLRFGAFPDFAQLAQSPRAFYLYGVYMLPMPRYGVWVPVLAIYAAALLHALRALLDGDDERTPRLAFFLSVLGLGLFAYYQGRSGIGNLFTASYPALLLLALYAGHLRREASPAGRPARRLQLTALLTLLFFSVPAIGLISPRWMRYVEEKITLTRQGQVSDVLRDARFLQEHIRPGQKVLIRSYQSGLYHLLTQTTSPLDVPGDSEIAYRRDYDKQRDYTFHGRGTVVLDKTDVLPEFIDLVRRAYPGRVISSADNMTLLSGP